jgi:hypothetical protein
VNLQGSLPAPGAMAVLEKTTTEHTRAAGSRSRGILHGLDVRAFMRASPVFSRGASTSFRNRDPGWNPGGGGLPPTTFSRGRELVVEI